jgi:hypothetical protein
MSLRSPRIILTCAAVAVALVVPASPAFASEDPAGDYCWENLDTTEVHCFGTEAELADDLAPQTCGRDALYARHVL